MARTYYYYDKTAKKFRVRYKGESRGFHNTEEEAIREVESAKRGEPYTPKVQEHTYKDRHPLYSTWRSMRSRCYNSNQPAYKWYGAKGIKICDRWLGDSGFENFVEDMGKRPEGHTLDRIDNDGDYSPENCRWADKHTQGANRRNSRELVGIRYRSSKWEYRIDLDYTQYTETGFNTEEEAVLARQKKLEGLRA